MKNNFDQFLALHHGAAPLLIANVWDVQSAKVFEKQSFKALATSSAAVAETLGYGDGEGMSFEEYLFMIRRIASSVSIPFSVDLEGGYGDAPVDICKHIAELYSLGVAGINLEDSLVTEGKRTIQDAEVFAKKLKQIVELLHASDIKVFINVRSDSFLLNLPDALQDAQKRIGLYQDTGVHGLFIPCITKIADIKKVTGHSRLPVNVMCMPGLPDFKQLGEAGVKRISMGPFLNMAIYKQLGMTAEKIGSEGSFDSLF